MPKSYSDDLQWRLVWLKLFYGMSIMLTYHASTLFICLAKNLNKHKLNLQTIREYR